MVLIHESVIWDLKLAKNRFQGVKSVMAHIFYARVHWVSLICTFIFICDPLCIPAIKWVWAYLPNTLTRESPRWFVITHPRGSIVNTSQLSVSWKLCRYKVTWLVSLHYVNMLTHQLDVKLHIVHYAKSAFNVYFHINLACKIKVNLICFTKSFPFVNTRKLCECD